MANILLSLPKIKNFQRAFLVLFCVAGGASLWMQGFILPSDTYKHYPSLTTSPLSPMNLSDILFPVPPATGQDSVTAENLRMLHSMFRCIEHRDCHENQTKVVILASPNFRDYLTGSRGGENIWARSTMRALENMGYTYLYTHNAEHTVQLYRMLPDLVKIIIVDGQESFRCFHDTDNCQVSERNPAGIPAWKIFSFYFWSDSQNPLGDKWTVAPEDYESIGIGHNTYLGYSIEEPCHQQPFIPHSERDDQAYLLAKYLMFFTPEHEPAWTTVNYDAATNATGVKYLIASTYVTGGEGSPLALPSNHLNIGQIGPAEFMEKLSKSRVLIGVGDPMLSPSPYDGLCMGVPFINPIMGWDHENPSDMSRWQTQHYLLQSLGPPYVYNVFKGDTDGFVQAIKDAISHPIASYVLERMRISSVEKRLAAILEKDWQSEATTPASLSQVT
jgi:hypothetical protein